MVKQTNITGKLKWQTFIYICWTTIISIYFIQTLFHNIQISFEISLFLAIDFSIITIAGYFTFKSTQEINYKNFSTLIYLKSVFNVFFIIFISYNLTTESNLKFRYYLEQELELYLRNVELNTDFLNQSQIEFGCCGIYSKGEFIVPQRNSIYVLNKLPLTCCEQDEIEAHFIKNEQVYVCPFKAASDKGCFKEYKTKLWNFKNRTIILILISMVFQSILIYSYRFFGKNDFSLSINPKKLDKKDQQLLSVK